MDVRPDVICSFSTARTYLRTRHCQCRLTQCPVNTDSFWELIEGCREQAYGRGERLAWLRGEFSQRPLAEIVRFQVCLDQVTHAAFTWDLWAAADRILGGWCSDDGFCYFASGWSGCDGMSLSARWPIPTPWPTLPRSRVWWGAFGKSWDDYWPAGESLKYVALEAHGLLTGIHDTCGEAFCEAVTPQQNRESAGRRPVGAWWDVRHEDEAVRKLARLCAGFPRRPLAL